MDEVPVPFFTDGCSAFADLPLNQCVFFFRPPVIVVAFGVDEE